MRSTASMISIVLLGIPPNAPETGYGWIEPGAGATKVDKSIYPVQGFWEKPTAELAQQLMARGCFWNSFVTIARAQTLLGVIEETMPALYRAFGAVLPALDTEYEARAIQTVYARLQPTHFSRSVLASSRTSPCCRSRGWTGVIWATRGGSWIRCLESR